MSGHDGYPNWRTDVSVTITDLSIWCDLDRLDRDEAVYVSGSGAEVSIRRADFDATKAMRVRITVVDGHTAETGGGPDA